MSNKNLRRRKEAAAQEQQGVETGQQEDQQETILRAIGEFEANKVYARRGNPGFIVTLSTEGGIKQVYGLDNRPLGEIVASWSGSTGIGDHVPTVLLRGIAELYNYGVVVARAKDVIAISSDLFDPDEDDDPDDPEEDDNDDDEDDGDTEPPVKRAGKVSHPLLGS